MRFKDTGEAAQALESTLVKELLESSGAFKGTATAGSHLNADMFMTVLADAVSKGNGLGIGKMIASSLEKHGGAKGDAALIDQHLSRPADPVRGLPGREMMPLEKLPLPLDKPPAERPAPPSPHPEAPFGGHGVSSNFGERIHPIDGTRRFHTGVDVRAAEGSTILAAAAGVVKRAGARGGYGNAVEIDHGNGVTTLYAHAQALSVQPGDTIDEGQALGFVGQTGKATGPHLHFEVRVEGKPVDPRRALNAYGMRAEVTIEEGPNQPSKSP
jgi:murein DD-endopeptidase MepM/ murein hydrolase activator NlpD